MKKRKLETSSPYSSKLQEQLEYRLPRQLSGNTTSLSNWKPQTLLDLLQIYSLRCLTFFTEQTSPGGRKMASPSDLNSSICLGRSQPLLNKRRTVRHGMLEPWSSRLLQSRSPGLCQQVSVRNLGKQTCRAKTKVVEEESTFLETCSSKDYSDTSDICM